MNNTSVYKRYKHFEKIYEDDKDDERSGRRSTSTTNDNIEKVKTIFVDIHRIAIRKDAYEVGISFGLCQAIFSAILGIRLVALKICYEIVEFGAKRVIIGDKILMYGYDFEAKFQSSQ